MTIGVGSRLGPYEIVAPIGAGGMGEVFAARDTRLDRRVAIKVLPPGVVAGSDLLIRLEREAKVIAKLNHPHICALYDVGSENGSSYLVMEMIEGETLADRIARAPLPIADVLRIGAQLASALDRAHRAGVIHRDVKPSNIMVTRHGAKLLDFGLAKSSTSADASLTGQGLVVGTPLYMAPEQLRGKAVDARTDIFALGVVLYEIATGRHPFEDTAQVTIALAILEHDPPPMRDLRSNTPAALEHIVQRCIAKDPDDRWQSAHDIADELQWIAESQGAVSASAVPVATKPPKKKIAWAVAGVVAAALIGAAAVVPRLQWTTKEAPLVADLAPPPGARFHAFGDDAGPVAVSPNGQFIVYSVIDGTVARLWLRSVLTGESRPIAGTEGAMFPFWSSDNHSIGFFTLRELKRVDLTGGAPIVIAACNGARGGSWGADGTILFSPASMGGLQSVPATGGTPKTVTTIDTALHTTHRWPFLLPDGRHFLYLAGSHQDPDGSANGIYLGDIDGDAPRLLVRGISNAIYAEGRLLFQRERTLYAQRLGRDFAVEGVPVTIAENVLYDTGVWRGAFSASDDGLLVYQSGRGALLSDLQWMDRRGVAGEKVGESDAYLDVVFSPDRQKVALVNGDPTRELWIHDLNRNTRMRIPLKTGFVDAVCWSNDGSTLFVNLLRDGLFELVAVKPDGGETLLARGERLRPVSMVPHAIALLAMSWTNVYRIPLDPPAAPIALALSSPTGFEGQLSPNGAWFLYAANEKGRREIFITSVADASRKWQVSTAGGRIPRWRADGGEIFYVDLANRFVSHSIAEVDGNLDIGPPQTLFTALFRPTAWAYDVSADGQRFLVNVITEQEPPTAVIVRNWHARAGE